MYVIAVRHFGYDIRVPHFLQICILFYHTMIPGNEHSSIKGIDEKIFIKGQETSSQDVTQCPFSTFIVEEPY
jgi:hypothetical protein